MIKCPLETEEQRTLVQYCNLKKIFSLSIPNGAILKGNPLQRARQMNKLKAEGLIVGASDFLVMLDNKMLFIELKRVKGSTTSKAQKEFINKANQYPYAIAKVCKGAKEAIAFIEENR